MDFAGATQYTRAFHSEPSWIKTLLWRNKVTSTQPDGELLDILLKEERPMIQDWILEHYDSKGQPLWDDDTIVDPSWDTSIPIMDLTLMRLQKLATLAINGKTVDKFTWAELWSIPHHRAAELTIMMDVSAVDKLLRKWRHYNPKGAKAEITKEAQLTLEKRLKDKWLERLLSHFLKVQSEIPKLAKFGKHEDVVRECKALFGKRRWRTIKKYTSELEAILKISPDFIPWDESKVRDWLNKLSSENTATPNKLTNLWNTIRPLSNIFEFIDPDGISDLKAKMEATMDELTASLLKQSFRAVVPSAELVRTLERLSMEHSLQTVRYYAATVRFAIATSARGNDLQHTCPSTWKITAETRELQAWQTKTTTVHETQKRPVPLIAPLHSFTGAPWWEQMDTTFALFKKDDKFKDLDFLFPALTKDKGGFIPRPASNAQVISVIREGLSQWVSPEVMWDMTDESGDKVKVSAHDAIKRFTMSACRVFLSEWSHLADLPLELRRWLGRWKEASTANTYTREHKGKILQIMARLKGKEYLVEAAGEVPEEISDDYFMTKGNLYRDFEPHCTDALTNTWDLVPTPDRPAKLPRLATMEQLTLSESLHADTFGEYESDLESLVVENEEDEQWYTTRQQLLQSTEGLRYPASQLPTHLDGPLSLVRTKVPTGKLKVKKFHLALTTRITVGCGMDATKCDIITGEEPIPLDATSGIPDEPPDKRLCERCFKFFYWDLADPDRLLVLEREDAWPAPLPQPVPIDDEGDSDSMASASGASVQSNDSDSESEALRPSPPQPHPG